MKQPAHEEPGSPREFDLGGLGPGAAFLWLLLLAVLFYSPILVGVRTFPDGDFTHHFLPFSLFHQAELLAGRLPVWNPYTYAGHPFLADPQAAVFYPVNVVGLLLTAPWRTAAARLYSLEVEAVLHVALAGFFTYLLVRDLAGRRWAAFLAGTCFAFSGYLTGYPPLQLAVLRTAVWLPLLLWLLGRAMIQPARWRWWLAAAATYATALFAGHPQTLLHLTYAAAAWTLLCWTLPAEAGYGHRRRLLGLAVAVTLAIGLSMAQLWPSVEYTRLSVRANVDYAYVSGGFPRQDAWQLLLPGVLTQFSPLYIGVAGLGLAAAGMALMFDRTQPAAEVLPSPFAGRYLAHRRRIVAFFIGLGAVALLLSFGANSFLYPLFYRIAPGWDLFRGQERAAYLVAFALSVLAGHGAAALPQLSPRLRRRTALLIGAAVTAGVYTFGLLWQLPGLTAVGPWRYLAIAFATLVLGLAVALLVWLPGWEPRRAYVLLALTIGNLFLANMGTNLDHFGPARKVLAAPEVATLEQAIAEQGDAGLGLPGRAYNEYRVYEDYGMAHGVEDVWASSPLRLARYAALFDQFPLDRMWDLTGVGHVLTWRRELFEPSTLLAEFPQATDTTYLHRLGDANPRARLLEEVQVASDADALARLADHGFDLDRVVLLSTDSGLDSGETLRTADNGGGTSIHLTRVRPGHLQVQVSSPAGGLLTVAENWMPGWRVENADCDSQAVGCRNLDSPWPGLEKLSVQRANLAFVGAPVPAGDVRFDLVYRPDSVRYGLLISGLALAVLIAAAGYAWFVGRVGFLTQRRKGAKVRKGELGSALRSSFALLCAFAPLRRSVAARETVRGR